MKLEYAKKCKEEERMWRQKARDKWIKEGEKKTAFINNMASARRRVNRIQSLLVGDASVDDKEEIVDHVVGFYKSLFSAENWCRPKLDMLEFGRIEEEADSLERQFDEEEIRNVVFGFSRDRAPGPDGFPLAFFQVFWEGNYLIFSRSGEGGDRCFLHSSDS